MRKISFFYLLVLMLCAGIGHTSRLQAASLDSAALRASFPEPPAVNGVIIGMIPSCVNTILAVWGHLRNETLWYIVMNAKIPIFPMHLAENDRMCRSVENGLRPLKTKFS